MRRLQAICGSRSFVECNVADPVHFDVDPDTSFHFVADQTFQFDADPDTAPY
jgi:hypothetical protein